MTFEGLLHDAVLIWAYGVNRTLEEGGVPDDGINITKNVFNLYFDGVSGSGQVRNFGNALNGVRYYQSIYIAYILSIDMIDSCTVSLHLLWYICTEKNLHRCSMVATCVFQIYPIAV